MARTEPDPVRRKLLTDGAVLTGAALTAGALPSLFAACEYHDTKDGGNRAVVDVSGEAALAEVGGAVYRTFEDYNDGRPVIIYRSGAAAYTVLTSVCTHQGCRVDLPDGPGGALECPCHDSRFDPSSGDVLKGPASAPLKVFPGTYLADSGQLRIDF